MIFNEILVALPTIEHLSEIKILENFKNKSYKNQI